MGLLLGASSSKPTMSRLTTGTKNIPYTPGRLPCLNGTAVAICGTVGGALYLNGAAKVVHDTHIHTERF
jgi:hypothetical protein